HEFDTPDLADQCLPEVAQRAAELAGERRQHRVPLLVVPPFVDEGGYLPVPRQNVSRDVAGEYQVEPGDVDVLDLAPLDAVRDDRIAVAEVGIFSNPARTVDVARARLDQRALERVDRPGLLTGLLNHRHGALLMVFDSRLSQTTKSL